MQSAATCNYNIDPYEQQQGFFPCLLEKLKNGENIIFTKYGDGEYQCMSGWNGGNCDGDTYHPWLGEELKKALVCLCKKPNTYIGMWQLDPVPSKFCNNLAKQNGCVVPWVWYHLIMNGDEFFSYDHMHQLVEFLIETKRKKILICNHLNARLKEFFKADVLIEIPPRNWSYEYDRFRNILVPQLEKDCIVLISGGLCSKVLINDITNDHDITCLDLGASFDFMGRKENSRHREHTYEDEVRYYQDLLPENWDSSEH